MTTAVDPATRPLPPQAATGFWRQSTILQRFQVEGLQLLSEGHPVTHLRFGPERWGPERALRMLLVSSAQGAHDVLAGADAGMDKFGPVHEDFRRLSPNIFNLDHDAWVPRKRALQPVFTKPRMGEYAAQMSGVVAETSRVWADRGRFDLQEQTRELTTEVLGRSLLGQPLGHRAGVLADAFDAMTGFVKYRATAVIKPPASWPTPGHRRYRAAERVALGICDQAIDDARRHPDRAAPLLHRLLEATDPVTGVPLTDTQRRNDLLTFVLAGHDTTATTLAYALWQVGREPAWQDAVAREAAAFGDRPLTPADVAGLPVAVRVLHEALRLCPPASAVLRKAMRDVVVDGFRVPAGWLTLVNIWALHHDPAVWPDTERFDPDRFTPERSAGRSRWQFLPFGGGQRACIGDHFAMLEATIALATLVRDLRFTSEGDYAVEFGFTTHSSAPVLVSVEPRGRG